MNKFFFKFTAKQKIRIKKNFFANINSESVQVLTQLFYPPLMILVWGAEMFGIWIFFISIPNLLLIFNFNFNNAVTQEMIIFYSKGNKSKVEQIFQNGIALTLLNILIFGLIALCSYFFFNFDFSITKNLSSYEINIILLLVIFSTLLNIFNGIFTSGIYFKGKQFIVTNISYISEIFLKAGIVFIGLLFKSLIYVAIFYFILTLIRVLVYFYYFLKNNKYLHLSLRKVSLKITFKLFKLSSGHTLEALHHLLKEHGLIILIGTFFNAQMITYISTVKTLFYHFPFRLLTSIQNISLFEYANLYAEKKFSELKNNHIKHIILILFILIIFIITAATIGPAFYEFWLNSKFDLSYILLLLVIFDASIQVSKTAINTVIKSLNIYFKVNLIEVLLILTAVSISYYLFSIGYSILYYFIMVLISSSLALVFSLYMLNSFYKEKKLIKK